MLPVPSAGTAVPALPVPFVRRPRLLAALAEGDDADTTLVCAPAGFGKTALLADWARSAHPAPTPIAWADLGAGRGDEQDLWQTIRVALEDRGIVAADGALRRLDPRRAGSQTSASVDAAVSALDALPVQVTLILHDVHAVAPAALDSLDALLAARPSGVRLVLCARWDTPHALAALRSAGRLREIRADQLRFSAEETSAMLRHGGLRLDEAQVAEVLAGTAGRPADVRLVSAALRHRADAGALMAGMAEGLQPVADFLVGEVLADLRPADRDLLAAIGDGGPVTAAAASLLSGRSDAHDVLDRLADETGLVDRESADRLRVHPLVHYHLRAGRRGSTADPQARAAPRPVAATDPQTAVRRALRTDNTGLLVDVVQRYAGILLVTEGPAMLGQVLARLGQDVVAQDPWLRICSTLTRIEAGLVTASDAAAPDSVDPPAGEAGARLAVLRSIAGLFAAASTGDLGAVPAAVDIEPNWSTSPEWAALALVAAGGRSMLVDADPAAATAALESALALARTQGFGYLEMQCLGLLGSVAGIAGDYPAMTAAAAGADAAATSAGWEAAPLATAARWMLAYGALLRAEPLEAHRLAVDAVRRGGAALRPRYAFALRSVQGAALFDAGQRRRGLAMMRQARADLGPVELSHEQAAALALIEYRGALAIDRHDAARDVEAWLSERVGVRGEILLMWAWSEQDAGRARAAHEAVRPVLDGTVTSILPYTLIEALLVEANGRITGGDARTARHALGEALSSGASLGVVRPFVTTGGQTRELLHHHLRRTARTEPAAAWALAAGLHASGDFPDAPVGLDDVERRLLARLPSSLSVDQIAGALRIPTREAHIRIREVYRKLGVSSRRTAVTVAYERGLL